MLRSFRGKVAKFIFICFVLVEVQMSIIINGIRAISGRRISPQKRMFQREVSNLLNQDINDIVELTKNSSKKQLSLLSELATNFNRFNFYREPVKKDNPKLVNVIVGKIKKPTKMHSYICNKFSDSLESLNTIIDWAGNNKKRLNFVAQLNEDLFKYERPDGNTLIPDLLKSEHADEYMKKYDEIRSYLQLNKDNPNVVSELDKKFAEKQFDGQYFNKELNTDKNRAKYPLLDRAIVNGESSLNLLTQENHKLARMMSKVFFPTDEMMKNGAAEDVANILISTNKKNAPLREELLGRFTPTIRGIDSDFSYEQDKKLKLLARLYDTIDADKNAKNFVRKSLPKLDGNFQLDEFVDILDNVSTKKLNIFRDNAWNIISKTTGKERIDALNNNITDAFFETESTRLSNRQKIQYGYIKRRSLFKNMSIRIKNSLNKLRDAVTSDTQPKISTTTEVVIPKNIEKIDPKPLVQPEKFVKKSIYTKPEILPISRTAKREILKEKVISFVKNKLGEKTFSRQSDDFGKNATQIRLKMLPEIFASIADTRKVDRMIGKNKNQSSNKDVLTLYSKINGQNKKFVNYMLKKRNADNSRMFEVRDIIAILDKAENKIANNKKLNSGYRAKDAKAYYNHLFDAKVEQYGKLQRAKKTK